MGTFLVRTFAVLTALSSFCLTENPTLACEEEKVKALQDIVVIQREVDQCQALGESQTKLSLVLDKLAGRLDQGLDVSLALAKLEGRLNDIEAKVDTQAGKMTIKLETMQASYEEDLHRIQDRLEAMQGSDEDISNRVEAFEHQTLERNTEALKNLTDRLDVIEDKLTGEEERLDCPPPFEIVGGDCVHLHDELITWSDARRYCQALTPLGDLLVPSRKQGFAVTEYRRKKADGPYPALFDFLERKRKLLNRTGAINAWLGGTADDDGKKARWTSGQEVQVDHEPYVEPGHCIGAGVYGNGEQYRTWSWPCSWWNFPVCQY